MKEIINDITSLFTGMTMKQNAILFYFIISFFMLFVSDETPILALLFIVINFANAVRLVLRVPLSEN